MSAPQESTWNFPPIPTALVAVGSLIVFAFLWLQMDALKVTRYATTQGRVKFLDPRKIQEHRGQLAELWEAEITYTFEVDGKTYQSTRYGSDGTRLTFHTKTEAMARLVKHPKNSPLMIYYDPADPERCYLELTTGLGYLKGGLVGALLVGLGVALALREWLRTGPEAGEAAA